MIHLNRLNGQEFILNCEMIRMIESTPDTVITLTSGEKLMVQQTVDDVMDRAMTYQKRIHQEPPEVRPQG